jgi:hypothetical protein
VPPRSGGLEGDLENPPRFLEPSFEAAIAAPQDEVEEGSTVREIRSEKPEGDIPCG